MSELPILALAETGSIWPKFVCDSLLYIVAVFETVGESEEEVADIGEEQPISQNPKTNSDNNLAGKITDW
ncbi:MAG TPA: hypothetical protein V6D28_24815 [Leptolyngbyaceae cyanobacterium]